jgi:hypothetical protein
MTMLIAQKTPADVTPEQLLRRLTPPLSAGSQSVLKASAAANTAVLTSPGRGLGTSVVHDNSHSSLRERLHDARVVCKVRTNMFAMHFGRDWQQKFFAQLDATMDAEEWDPQDQVPTETAFATLLRILLILRNKRRPGLAAGPNGTIIATWTIGANRLTLQCQSGDCVLWFVTQVIDGEPDTAAGQTTVANLMQRLQSFNPEQWFTNEGR